MSTFKSLEEAREYFKKDTFAAANGIVIDQLDDAECICSMDIRDDHKNAIGGVMGGVIYTLADFAFAVSSNNNHSPTVALEANINFLSAPKGTKLFARSSVLKSGRTTCVINVLIYDDLGKEIAFFNGTGYKL